MRESRSGGIAVRALAIVVALSATACPSWFSSTPQVVLESSDCATSDITVQATARKSASGGNQWNVRLEIEVKCAGQPLPGAKLKVKFWFTEAEILTTGPDGKANRSHRVHADPTGQSINVTIKGSDGTEKTTTATMP